MPTRKLPFKIRDKETARKVLQWTREHLTERKKEFKEAITIQKGQTGTVYIFSFGNIALAKVLFVEGIVRVINLAVHSGSLRNGVGIGTALMQRIEEEARCKNSKRIEVSASPIRPEDVPAEEYSEWYKKYGKHPYYFYKKLGFKPLSKYTEDMLKEKIRRKLAITMTKHFKPE